GPLELPAHRDDGHGTTGGLSSISGIAVLIRRVPDHGGASVAHHYPTKIPRLTECGVATGISGSSSLRRRTKVCRSARLSEPSATATSRWVWSPPTRPALPPRAGIR